jgi:hypothetical protein
VEFEGANRDKGAIESETIVFRIKDRDKFFEFDRGGRDAECTIWLT